MTQYNVTLMGGLTNTGGVLSGFDGSNYALLPNNFNPESYDFEIVFKIGYTGQDMVIFRNVLDSAPTNPPYYDFEIWQSKLGMFYGDGTYWLSGEISGTTTLTANSDYWAKVTKVNSSISLYLSTDGSTWNLEATGTDPVSSIPSSGVSTRIGYRTSTTNTIDLNGCYIKIDNNYFWQGATSTPRTTIQLRRDTASNWSTINPILAIGEVGIETDTRKQKFGDGTTAWNSLAYSYGSTALQPASISTMVTTDTDQTIPSTKIFSNGIRTNAIYNTDVGAILSDYNSEVRVGTLNRELRIRGNATHPKYTTDNSTFKDIAFTSDIPTITLREWS